MFLSLGHSVKTRLVWASRVYRISFMWMLLNYHYSSRVLRYLFVDWRQFSPEKSCDMPKCTIFSVLFFGSKGETAFLHKLNFTLHVIIFLSIPKFHLKTAPNIMKIKLPLAPVNLLSKFNHTSGNFQGFTSTLTYICHDDERAVLANL